MNECGIIQNEEQLIRWRNHLRNQKINSHKGIDMHPPNRNIDNAVIMIQAIANHSRGGTYKNNQLNLSYSESMATRVSLHLIELGYITVNNRNSRGKRYRRLFNVDDTSKIIDDLRRRKTTTTLKT